METANESILGLQSIIDDVTEYMKATSDESLVLSELESKLRFYIKYDLQWVGDPDRKN